MPNWAEILQEMVAHTSQTPIDDVRRKYIGELYKHTGRNIIAYYSGWLQKPGINNVAITDDDKNGFMMAIHGMKCDLGLDLILHTPGGEIAATESIIDYLHRKFGNNIRVIIPQLAMSAGTMIACSGKSIVMGRQSNLGPIDPQLQGLPAHAVLDEFKRAHIEIKEDPSKISVWQFILQKYHPTFLTECENAIALSQEFVRKNLINVMFNCQENAEESADRIVEFLSAYMDRKTHGRHIHIDECEEIGLKIERLENDPILQDLVLTVHHCFMHSLSNSQCCKITENHNGITMVKIST